MSELRITATCPHCGTRIPLAIEGLRPDNTASIKCYACGDVFEVRGKDYSQSLRQRAERESACL